MHDVVALRRAHSIADVIASTGVELRKTGNRFCGRCPLHDDRDPSLVVYPSTQSYFCFSCQHGGDVIDFLSRRHNVGFKEAVTMLGNSVPEFLDRHCTAHELAADPLRNHEDEARVVAFAADLFHAAFWRSSHARRQLARRGISGGTARRWRIGFGCSDLAASLRRSALSLEAARDVGLLDGDRNTFGGRLVIPSHLHSSATWLTARSINGEGPRYLNLRLPTPVLGLAQVDGPEVILTEGPFDWLTLVQWGLPAAALAGTHVSEHAINALRRFERVYLAMDNDEAGERVTRTLCDELGSTAVEVRLPEFAHDVNDLVSYPDGERLFRSRLAEAAAGEEVQPWAGPVSSAA